LDNLYTHKPGPLYATFPSAETHRLQQKLEFYYSPNQVKWLNRAEITWSIFARQCLQRRVATGAPLVHELAVVETTRNATRATIHWQFTTAAARVKFAHFYTSTSP
jgi:hypothetical protein